MIEVYIKAAVLETVPNGYREQMIRTVYYRAHV